jgi:hypothetical protein
MDRLASHARPGIDAEFGRALDEAVKYISAHPVGAPVHHDDVRRVVIRPPFRAYSVFYRVMPHRVPWIVAVVDTRRDPREYMGRR